MANLTITPIPDVTVTRERRPPKPSEYAELVDTLESLPAAKFVVEHTGEALDKWVRGVKREASRRGLTAVFGDLVEVDGESEIVGSFDAGTEVQVKLVEKKAGRPRVRNVTVEAAHDA